MFLDLKGELTSRCQDQAL